MIGARGPFLAERRRGEETRMEEDDGVLSLLRMRARLLSPPSPPRRRARRSSFEFWERVRTHHTRHTSATRRARHTHTVRGRGRCKLYSHTPPFSNRPLIHAHLSKTAIRRFIIAHVPRKTSDRPSPAVAFPLLLSFDGSARCGARTGSEDSARRSVRSGGGEIRAVIYRAVQWQTLRQRRR